VRPWQHVLNPLSGYLVLAQALWETPEHAGGWNFGPVEDDARPVRWILERLAASWPGPLDWVEDPGPHPPEAHHLKIDSSRARTRLGWRPGWGLDEGLDRLVDWYAALREGEAPREVTLAQIDAFAAAR
jgi:CDP-glucose 4,6-dehydratase